MVLYLLTLTIGENTLQWLTSIVYVFIILVLVFFINHV